MKIASQLHWSPNTLPPVSKDKFIWSYFYVTKFLVPQETSKKTVLTAKSNHIQKLHTNCIVVLSNRNHSGRPFPRLFWPPSSPSASTTQATISAFATSATTANNTTATTSTGGRTGRARRTASSQEVFILLSIAFTVVYSVVFHGLVYILRHVAHSTEHWTSQGKLKWNYHSVMKSV